MYKESQGRVCLYSSWKLVASGDSHTFVLGCILLKVSISDLEEKTGCTLSALQVH